MPYASALLPWIADYGFTLIGVDGRRFVERPVDLRRELSELRYDDEAQALRGALQQVVNRDAGIDAYFGKSAMHHGDFVKRGRRSSMPIASLRRGPACRQASSLRRFSGGGMNGVRRVVEADSRRLSFGRAGRLEAAESLVERPRRIVRSVG